VAEPCGVLIIVGENKAKAKEASYAVDRFVIHRAATYPSISRQGHGGIAPEGGAKINGTRVYFIAASHDRSILLKVRAKCL